MSNIQNRRSSSPPSSVRSSPDAPLLPSTASMQRSYRVQYRVYPWRWFMLASITLLNISNGMLWLTFAPIPDFTAEFYNVSEDDVNLFSLVFFVVSLVIGLFSIVVLDTWGLKVSLYLGATFNLVGAVLRWLSTIDPIVCSSVFNKAGFFVAMISQFLCACAQPFLLYAPTKLASLWFGPKERTICTMLASVANLLGIAVTQLASPYIVTSTDKLPMLLWIYSIPPAVGAVMTAVSFWWSRPPIPPAATAEPDRQSLSSFFKGLLKTLTCWPFWVLLLTWGVGGGSFNAFLTLLPQILCPFGYTDRDAGLWGSLMIFLGLIGATIAGLIADYTKKFKEIAVFTLAMAILCMIWFMEVFRLHNQSINIAFSVSLFGFFALPLIPICMELGVEVTYPVAEATSSGMLWSAAPIMGIVLLLLGPVLQTDLSPHLMQFSKCNITSNASPTTNSSIHTCFRNTTTHTGSNTQTKDFGHALIFYIALTTVMFVLFVVTFPPRYRRVEAEKRSELEKSVIETRTR